MKDVEAGETGSSLLLAAILNGRIIFMSSYLCCATLRGVMRDLRKEQW